uniref:CNH domain-containing protein n=1 Tax=Trichobilharzia regenti TaxID=157069 RepID=A0AA85KH44_TRIRE|nr:unnamed protein product [Trichobilharzia regenti]
MTTPTIPTATTPPQPTSTTTTTTIDIDISNNNIASSHENANSTTDMSITTSSTNHTNATTTLTLMSADDIHPIDDAIDIDGIDNNVQYDYLLKQKKTHTTGSLQCIPQEEIKTNKKKKKQKCIPCSDMQTFSASLSSHRVSSPLKLNIQDDMKVTPTSAPSSSSSTTVPSMVNNKDNNNSNNRRSTASVLSLTSPSSPPPLPLQQPSSSLLSTIKMTSTIELNATELQNQSVLLQDSSTVSSVKLRRRTTTAPTTAGPIAAAPAPAASATTNTEDNHKVLSIVPTSTVTTSTIIAHSPVSIVSTNEIKKSRASMIELINCQSKDVLRQVTSSPGLSLSPLSPSTQLAQPPSPPRPSQGNKMGACFSLVFESCPLKINSTATWTNPANNGQVILFGTNDGIYCLNLKGLAENSLNWLSSASRCCLECVLPTPTPTPTIINKFLKLFPRRCLWLSVTRDTMMSLSGRHPQLYAHNLVSLMKLKSQGHPMFGSGGAGSTVAGGGSVVGTPSKFGKFVKLFPKRFSPSKKMPDTKGCRCAKVTRNPFNGAKYLCAAMTNEILIMEWFNPISSFIEIKRILIPDMPSPLLNFDLLIVKNLPLPFVCLGVYRHHSRKGRDGQRFRLHLIDLNSNSGPSPSPLPSTPVPAPTSAVVTPSHPPTSLMTQQTSSAAIRTSPHSVPQSPAIRTTPPTTTTTATTTTGDSSLPNHQSVVQPIGGGNDESVQVNSNTSSGSAIMSKTQQLKAELQRKNTQFLPEDILPVVETVQLEHNTILICFQVVTTLEGVPEQEKLSS